MIFLSRFFPVTPADPDVEISLHHVQSQSHPTRRARTNTTQVNNIVGFLNIKRYFPEIVLLNSLEISHCYIQYRPWLSNNLQCWLLSFISLKFEAITMWVFHQSKNDNVYNSSQDFFALLAFCCVLLWFGTCRFYPYISGLLHWCLSNRVLALVPVKQIWRIRKYE